MLSSSKAIVLVDPITEWREVLKSALDLKYCVISIQDAGTAPRLAQFSPSLSLLREAGVSYTLTIERRDVFDSIRQLQILMKSRDLNVVSVIPLSEVAVEASDVISAALGLPHNPLKSLTARRDKGLMKDAVQSRGLAVAKYARVKTLLDLCTAIEKISLSYPVVVKTPAGMSTSDVYICSNVKEAGMALQSIVSKIGPDGRRVDEALLEEFILGTEFAVNLMAFQNSSGEQSQLCVTDMWKYSKNQRARYGSAEICKPRDFPELVTYATNVARAVGVQYGAAHVELKATLGEDGLYTNPIMIEVGARLSGGRKSTMAQEVCCFETSKMVETYPFASWNPFESLIKSHCAGLCSISSEPYLTPTKFVRHIFLPIEKSGRITKFEFNESRETIHSSSRLVAVGDTVKATTDIVSCAGFVWLIGNKEKVDEDTEAIMSSFVFTTTDVLIKK